MDSSEPLSVPEDGRKDRSRGDAGDESVYTRVVSSSRRKKAVAGRRAAGGTRSVILNCRSRARRPRAGDTILSPKR